MGIADDLARHNADLAKHEREKSRHDLLHVGPPPSEAGEVLPALPERREAGRDRGPGSLRKAGAGMTARPEKYFVHFLDGRRSLAVHRLDELVQITYSHGPDDEHPDVVFFAPSSAHALVEAIDHAARDAQAVFDEGQAARRPQAQRADVAPDQLPEWGPAFAYGGLPYVFCPAGDGAVGCGQSAVAETATGRIWHDDCAEDAATHRQSLNCPPLTPASAPSNDAFGEVGGAGGADGAAGGRASAGPHRPAAPSPTR